jgi:hypothetical protein
MKYGDFQFWVGNFADDSHDVNITELTMPVIMLLFREKFGLHPISVIDYRFYFASNFGYKLNDLLLMLYFWIDFYSILNA